MKKVAFLVAVVAAAVAAGAYVAAPRLRLFRLERALFAATDAKTAAPIARAILKNGGPPATDALIRYANQHPWCSFDPLHNVALFCDETNGQIHIVYVGPDGPEVSTGDPGLDKAVRAAIPEVTGETLTVGEPPHLFTGIHLLPPETDRADFVLRPKATGQWYRVEFDFKDGRLAVGSYDVSNADLSRWRKNADWPKSWQ
jgi:hypothetical protein